jgi:L-2-hydroxyglutarate oxidase LhgO
MQTDFDTIVVGAGVIGLAVAREEVLSGSTVLVLEKQSAAGLETSSRNSEVIHAGIYYPAQSLKAQLCVAGRQFLYEYCAAHGVATKPVGKLIVATSTPEEAKLQSIKNLAEANGVHDLQWLTASDVSALEPEVHCSKALFSPATGIVDASGFMLSLQGDAENAGTTFAFNARFVSALVEDDLFVVKALDAAGSASDISCRRIYNCAGHGAHGVASGVAGYRVDSLPPRYLARGSYCSVSGKSPFRHLVYPVPVAGALGIHATLDMGGAVRFGPDISWVDEVDYTLPEGLPEKFATAVQSYWPGVRGRELLSSYCGIRPKIHGPESGFADFLIQTEAMHGVAGLINFFGIESPGLTASLAIAKYACHPLDHATTR